MYIDYYRLEKKPFELTVDPFFLWMSDKHKEAMAVLRYGLLDNKGFIMLTGDVGIGKTTLVNAFINSLGPETLFANISNPGLKRIELYNLLGSAFKLGTKFSGKDEFLISFRGFLEKSYRDGKQVLLIIDEAQRLGRALLEEFRLLSNIELQSDKLMNIFFVGQDELEETLERHENRALRQRMSLIYHIEPLSAGETGDYIRHRLNVAGTEKRIFTQNAIREIYGFSGGYPRVINIICDHAMLTGYVSQKKTIDTPEIIECARELRLKKKSDPESSPGEKTPKIIWQDKTAWSKKISEIYKYLPYIAGFFFLLILFCVIYFPLKRVASHSDAPPNPPVAVQEEAERPEHEAVGAKESENTNVEPEESQKADNSKIQKTTLSTLWQSIPDSEKRYTIAFGLGADDIAPEAYERLTKTASLLKENPELTLTITGHTDNTGETAYNTLLSQQRADIAKKFLVGKGIAPERITAIGKGSDEPIADNNSADGRSMNRRVEVVVTPPSR